MDFITGVRNSRWEVRAIKSVVEQCTWRGSVTNNPVIRHCNVTITIHRSNAIIVIRYCSMIAVRLSSGYWNWDRTGMWVIFNGEWLVIDWLWSFSFIRPRFEARCLPNSIWWTIWSFCYKKGTRLRFEMRHEWPSKFEYIFLHCSKLWFANGVKIARNINASFQKENSLIEKTVWENIYKHSIKILIAVIIKLLCSSF